MDSDRHDRDLDWLAFCYIADELSGGDRDAFEQRLGDDQNAREAVARAVELSCTMLAGQSGNTAAARRLRWWRMATAACASLAVAASLAFIILSQTYIGGGDPHEANLGVTHDTETRAGGDASPGKEPPSGSGRSYEALAVAWTETRDTIGLHEAELFQYERLEDSPFVEEVLAEIPVEPLDTGSSPDWMLAAVMDLSGASETEVP